MTWLRAKHGRFNWQIFPNNKPNREESNCFLHNLKIKSKKSNLRLWIMIIGCSVAIAINPSVAHLKCCWSLKMALGTIAWLICATLAPVAHYNCSTTVWVSQGEWRRERWTLFLALFFMPGFMFCMASLSEHTRTCSLMSNNRCSWQWPGYDPVSKP